jgi:O-antigen/teichoic acid export membrane protein
VGILSTAVGISRAPARGRPATRGRIAREQLLVAGAQMGSGVGNLVYALVAARLLEPRGFAQLAAFLGLYLLVHIPASSLSAATALDPALAHARRQRAVQIGLGGAALLMVLAFPLSSVAHVPAAMLFALATAVPAAGWLALERGRLYGDEAHGRAAASLAIEPVVRLVLGVPLMLTLGAIGGAAAVVAGGFAALVVAVGAEQMRAFARAAGDGGMRRGARTSADARFRRGARMSADLRFRRDTRLRAGVDARTGVDARAGADARARSRALWATLAFLALAIVQNQDVVLANAVLPAGEAGRFAVLSTLGGAAAFATTTVPLVLLPRAARGEPHALQTAIGAAFILGAGAVLFAAIVPASLMGAAFGDRYESVTGLAVPYLSAMALLGVARVLIAHASAQGRGRRAAIAVGAVAFGQAIGLLAASNNAAALSHVTLAATASLAVIALIQTIPWPARIPLDASPVDTARARAAAAIRGTAASIRAHPALSAITAAALVVRLLPTRGIWLDEATSITQAQMPLGKLLDTLRTTDVHPPLHHLILWVLAHTAGTGELVMRAPSIIAGAALVPVVYALARELYDERAGLLAAALAASAPFLVWYSQEARMYGLFMLFASLALLGQLRALRRGERRDWALYGIATVLLIWTQYFSALFTLTQQAVFLAALWRTHRAGGSVKPLLRRWLGTTALIAIALLPLASFAHDQFAANQASGRGFNSPQQAGHVDAGHAQPTVYSALTNLLWAVIGYHSNAVMAALTALWPLAMLGTLMMLGRRSQPRSRYVLACALAPALAMMAIGFAKPFLFEVRYFAATAPLLLVLLARAATGWVRRGVATLAVGGVLVAGMGVAAADQQLNGSNPRVYDFEGAVGEVNAEARRRDVLLYEPAFLTDVINYYGPTLRARPLEKGVPKHARRIFLLGSFQDIGNNKQATQAAVKKLGRAYHLTRQMSRPQIHIWVFQKGAKR